jgi:hypothetical protein
MNKLLATPETQTLGSLCILVTPGKCTCPNHKGKPMLKNQIYRSLFAKGNCIKIRRWLAKPTSRAAIAPAVLALLISPTVSFANIPAKKSHHHARQSAQFQEDRPISVPNAGDGWYTPPRSPGFHDDFGS